MAITLTSSARFQPYSFEEMLKPYQMMTEEYNKREAEIAALDTKAETMRQYAQQEIDKAKLEGRQPASFATQYMNYANSLDKAAEDLATKGLRGTNRKTIYDLTNQYQTNVLPIENALKTRTAKADEQRKALLANPDLMFSTDFSNVSLQDLIDNPNLGYTIVAGDDLYKKGAAAAAAYSTRLHEINPALNNQYLEIKNGVGKEIADRWLMNQDIPELNAIMDNILQASGVTSNNLDRAKQYVKEGMYSGMVEKVDYKDNKAYDYVMRDWLNQQNYNRNEASKLAEEARKRGYEALDDNNALIREVEGIGIVTPRGFSGTYSNDINRLEGIYSIGNEETGKTISSKNLDVARLRYDNAVKAYNDIKDKVDEDTIRIYNQKIKSIQNSKGMTQLGETMNLRPPKDYAKYNDIIQEYDAAKLALQEEENFIKDFSNKYWYLGDTDDERVSKGYQLQKTMESGQIEDWVYNKDSNTRKEVSAGIANVLKSYIGKQLNTNSVGLINSKGKTLSSENMQAILENPEKLSFKVTKNPKGESYASFVLNNEEYRIKADKEFNEWINDINRTNIFLSDYNIPKEKSSGSAYQVIEEGINNLPYINDASDWISTLENNNVSNIIYTGNPYKDKEIWNELPVVNKNADLRGITVYNRGDNSVHKLIIDSSGNIKAHTDTNTEINDLGTTRSRYVDELIKMGMYKLKSTYAQKEKNG